MTTLELERSVSFKNILMATDFSEASRHALECAAAITETNQANLYILHTLPPEPRLGVPLDPLPDRDVSDARADLDGFAADRSLSHVRHQEILDRGPIWESVLDTIQRKKIDLLVLGTHGRTGLTKLVLGSTAEQIFRRAPCPVLTIGPSAKPPQTIRRVLFATDFGHASFQALPYAVAFANTPDGELTLLHVAAPMPIEYVGPTWYPGTDLCEREKASQQKIMRRLQSLLPVDAGLKCKVWHSVGFHFALEGILEAAKKHAADLIVMGVRKSGTTGARVAAHMPWAIAYDVVCNAKCPVLTVRG